MKLLTLIASMILMLGVAAPSQAKLRGLELGYEASPGTIVLPTSVGGGLVLRRSETAPPRTLPTDASTQYLVGDSEVTLEQMRRVLRDNPYATLTVLVSKSSGVVTRVKVQGDVAAATPAR